MKTTELGVTCSGCDPLFFENAEFLVADGLLTVKEGGVTIVFNLRHVIAWSHVEDEED